MILIYNFEFDNTTSLTFGLVIANINGSGLQNSSTFSQMDIITDKAVNALTPYSFGRKINDNLIFDLTIVSRHSRYYDNFEQRAIHEWLFFRASPKLLTIFKDDGLELSYECWINNPQKITTGFDKVIGWNFSVVCTSAFGITKEKEVIYNCIYEENQFSYFNFSNVEEYIYPKMEIELDENTSYIRLENVTDNNRITMFNGVRNGEKINIDNEIKIIETVSKLNILDKFNNKFFRFTIGENIIKVTGKCKLKFTNKFYINTGGI